MNKSLLIIISTLIATSSYASNPDAQSVKPFQVGLVMGSNPADVLRSRATEIAAPMEERVARRAFLNPRMNRTPEQRAKLLKMMTPDQRRAYLEARKNQLKRRAMARSDRGERRMMRKAERDEQLRTRAERLKEEERLRGSGIND